MTYFGRISRLFIVFCFFIMSDKRSGDLCLGTRVGSNQYSVCGQLAVFTKLINYLNLILWDLEN